MFLFVKKIQAKREQAVSLILSFSQLSTFNLGEVVSRGVGELVLHRIIGGDVEALVADEGEFALEIVVGESTRVLEIAETGVGEDVQVAVGDERFEGTAALIGFGVLGIGEPAKEVVLTIKERFLDEMVADAEVGFAFLVEENRSFAVEDFAH